MTVRAIPVGAIAEAGLVLLARRVRTSRPRLRRLLAPAPGRGTLTVRERRLAGAADRALRRIGVRCLWRAVVVTEMLRRRGVAARIRLSVAVADPADAHAEVEVGGSPLYDEPPERVVLR